MLKNTKKKKQINGVKFKIRLNKLNIKFNF